MDFTVNGRDFRVTKETIRGAQGFSLREWDSEPAGGRNILHDFGLATVAEALALAEGLV